MKIVFVVVLALLIGAEAWWLTWLTYGRIGWTLLLLTPLLICVPWVVSGGHKARLVACLVSLPYFVHGATEATAASASRTGALAVSGLCLTLYILLVLNRRQPQPG
ncbi:MAG: DUF2069 domain-containing protein [Pseudomonadota bacterium]